MSNKPVDRQALVQQYWQLLNSGVPAAVAFKQVFPNGIPTATQQAVSDAQQKQSNGLVATGGSIAGLLGVRALTSDHPFKFLGIGKDGGTTVVDPTTGAKATIPPAPTAPVTQTTLTAQTPSTGIPGSNPSDYANLPNAPVRGPLGTNASDYSNLPNADGSPVGQTSAPSTTLPDGSTNTLPPGATVTSDGKILGVDGKTIGGVVQGAAGLYQMYQGINQFKTDKIGGTLNVAAGGANAVAGAEAAGLTSAGGSTAGEMVPYINAALGAYNVYNALDADTGTYKQKVAQGIKQGTIAVGNAYTYGLAGMAYGALNNNAFGRNLSNKLDSFVGHFDPVTNIIGSFGSSKGQDQTIRDAYREQVLKNKGALFGKDYQGTLADGSKFNFGAEGTLGDKHFDFTKATTQQGAAGGNLLSILQGVEDKKARTAIAHQFLGASTANSGDDVNIVNANLKHFMNQVGFADKAAAQKRLDDLLVMKRGINQHDHDIYTNTLNSLDLPVQPSAQLPGQTTAPGAAPQYQWYRDRNGKTVRKDVTSTPMPIGPVSSSQSSVAPPISPAMQKAILKQNGALGNQIFTVLNK